MNYSEEEGEESATTTLINEISALRGGGGRAGGRPSRDVDEKVLEGGLYDGGVCSRGIRWGMIGEEDEYREICVVLG